MPWKKRSEGEYRRHQTKPQRRQSGKTVQAANLGSLTCPNKREHHHDGDSLPLGGARRGTLRAVGAGDSQNVSAAGDGGC